jgi:hypothetical protein
MANFTGGPKSSAAARNRGKGKHGGGSALNGHVEAMRTPIAACAATMMQLPAQLA